VLRAEKGYIAVGHDTDGTVTPLDLGMGWIIDKKKPDFIGKRGLARSDLARPGRPQLVGLLTEDPQLVLPEGSQLVAASPDRIPAPPVRMIGRVTSSYFSPTLGHSIALALLDGGLKRMGETVTVVLPDRAVLAIVGKSRFYDLEGERLHG